MALKIEVNTTEALPGAYIPGVDAAGEQINNPITSCIQTHPSLLTRCVTLRFSVPWLPGPIFPVMPCTEQGPNKYLCDYITSGVTHVNKYREYLKLNKYLKIKKAQRSLVQTFTE